MLTRSRELLKISFAAATVVQLDWSWPLRAHMHTALQGCRLAPGWGHVIHPVPLLQPSAVTSPCNKYSSGHARLPPLPLSWIPGHAREKPTSARLPNTMSSCTRGDVPAGHPPEPPGSPPGDAWEAHETSAAAGWHPRHASGAWWSCQPSTQPGRVSKAATQATASCPDHTRMCS